MSVHVAVLISCLTVVSVGVVLRQRWLELTLLRQRWSSPLVPTRRWTVLPATVGSLSATETVRIELADEEPSDVSIPSPDDMAYPDEHADEQADGLSGDGYESDDVVITGESGRDREIRARVVQRVDLPDCAWATVSAPASF